MRLLSIDGPFCRHLVPYLTSWPTVLRQSRTFFSVVARFAASFSHRCFPITAVEMRDLQPGDIHSVNTAQVDVDFLGIGTGDIKRSDAASRAEMMPGSVGVERVRSEIFPWCQ